MITLAFLLDHQVISRSDKNTVVAGSKNYVRARFILRTDDWARPITAIFGGYTQLLDDNNECTVPWEVLQQPGKVEVSAFCGDLHTANIAVVPVEKTGYKSGETPKDPTPDVYDQLAKMVQEAVDTANSVREDADAGVFDGEQGPDGPKGDTGLGVPSPAQSDAGKVPTVKPDGTGYQLAGPYAPLSAAIRPTASGNPVNITDSVEWPLQGLKVYGKSSQVTTTGAQLFDTKSFTEKNAEYYKLCEDGGVIQIQTDNRGIGTLPISQELAAGTYTASINTANGSGAFQIVKSGVEIGFVSSDRAFTFALEAPAQMSFKVLVSVPAYPMLVSGSTAKPWEPYTGGKPSPSPEYPQPIVSAGDDGSIALTVSNGASLSQSMTISTPNGLPGIPVDSGGNYTDVSGQQWKCNIIDGNQNVRNTETIIVDGNSTIENIDTTLADTTRFTVPLTHTGKVSTYLSICSHAKYKIIWIANETGFYVDKSNIIFRFPKNLIGETAESIKAWLSMQANNGTPLQMCYQLAKPIKTPLSEEEIAAYRALHTYDGVTVVSTPEDVTDIEVRYVANGEKYIDRKISEAIASAAATQLASYDALSDAIHEGVNEA